LTPIPANVISVLIDAIAEDCVSPEARRQQRSGLSR
jgi:hypothetical protein